MDSVLSGEYTRMVHYYLANTCEQFILPVIEVTHGKPTCYFSGMSGL
jgi:hypothetical protein